MFTYLNVLFYLLFLRLSSIFSLMCLSSDFCFFALAPSFNLNGFTVFTINQSESELSAFLLVQTDFNTGFLKTQVCQANNNACIYGFDFNPSFDLQNESFLHSFSSNQIRILHNKQNNNLYALAPCKEVKVHRRSHQIRDCFAYHEPERSCLFSDTCAFYYKYVLLIHI